MITFFMGIVILIIGGLSYGKYLKKMFRPDGRKTPSVRFSDGVDYVCMGKWHNSLIHFSNIVGIGSVFGAIQGIFFGPVAFLTIPVCCILGGVFHDYMTGMISMRNNAEQMPKMIKKYLGKKVYLVYNVIVIGVLIVAAAMFLYLPSRIFANNILNSHGGFSNIPLLVFCGVILIFYIVAASLPIDKLLGKIKPLFSGIILILTAALFVGMCIKGYPLTEIWTTGVKSTHPDGTKFIPICFLTVASGALSGYHSTQTTMLARTLRSERDGEAVFFYPMIAEGVIMMVFAAIAMGLMNMGIISAETPMLEICETIGKTLFGSYGGVIVFIFLIILCVTTGDTAIRSARMITEDNMKLEQLKVTGKLKISTIVALVALFLVFCAKSTERGEIILWKYFAWSNVVLACFSFAMITVYMKKHRKPYLISLILGVICVFITVSYVFHSNIGLGLSWKASYGMAAVGGLFYSVIVLWESEKIRNYRNRRY